jgi:hypothetical protein
LEDVVVDGAGDGAGVLPAQPARATAAAMGTRRFFIMWM